MEKRDDNQMTRSPPQRRPIPPREPIDWGCTKIWAKSCPAVRRRLSSALCFKDYNPRCVCIPAISPVGFETLTTYGLWPRAMRAISEFNPHPRAQRRFHRSWGGNGWMVRGLVNDDDIYFRALRVLFPPYRGGAKVLYRGQLAGMWAGVSWTSNYMVAEEYAFHGIDTDLSDEEELKDLPDHTFRIPRHLMFQPLPDRRLLILQRRMRDEIITKLPDRRSRDPEFKHPEYICDPRGVAYESFAAADLPDPRI